MLTTSASRDAEYVHDPAAARANAELTNMPVPLSIVGRFLLRYAAARRTSALCVGPLEVEAAVALDAVNNADAVAGADMPGDALLAAALADVAGALLDVVPAEVAGALLDVVPAEVA